MYGIGNIIGIRSREYYHSASAAFVGLYVPTYIVVSSRHTAEYNVKMMIFAGSLAILGSKLKSETRHITMDRLQRETQICLSLQDVPLLRFVQSGFLTYSGFNV